MLKRLSILPTCGTKYYQYQKSWKQLYATGADCIQVRDPEETKRVIEAITLCLDH